MTVDLKAAWRQEAKCVGRGLEFDYFVDNETVSERRTRMTAAVDVCKTCPVRVPCSQDIDYSIDQGVRAGLVIADGELQTLRQVLVVNRGQHDREHGTERGYYQHRKRGDLPICEPCRAAYRAKDRVRSQRARDRRRDVA